jgi:hypothetical protein
MLPVLKGFSNGASALKRAAPHLALRASATAPRSLAPGSTAAGGRAAAQGC